MKIRYDPDADTLNIILKDAAIVESDEDKPGVILDYDEKGDLVSVEILDASARVGKPAGVEFEVTRPAA